MAGDAAAGYRGCGSLAGSVLLCTTGLRGTATGNALARAVGLVRVRQGNGLRPVSPRRVSHHLCSGCSSQSPGRTHLVSVALFSLCFSLCFQGERGMPGLPGRHGTKVPCKQRSDACLPDLTHTSRLSLMRKHHLDLCVCLLANDSSHLNSFCF